MKPPARYHTLYIDLLAIVMRPAKVATDWEGKPVSAAEASQIALGMTARWINEIDCERVVWACDHPDPNWREFVYPAYKAHRTTDTGPYAAAMLEMIPPEHETLMMPGYEADDLIATLVAQHPPEEPVAVLTIDSDYFQMLRPGVTLFRPMPKGLLDMWDEARVCEKFGLDCAARYVEWKALVGDKADGIPGIKGIGEKKATKLLAEHGSLIKLVQSGALGSEAENALLWQSLIKLRQDVRGLLAVTGNTV